MTADYGTRYTFAEALCSSVHNVEPRPCDRCIDFAASVPDALIAERWMILPPNDGSGA